MFLIAIAAILLICVAALLVGFNREQSRRLWRDIKEKGPSLLFGDFSAIEDSSVLPPTGPPRNQAAYCWSIHLSLIRFNRYCISAFHSPCVDLQLEGPFSVGVRATRLQHRLLLQVSFARHCQPHLHPVLPGLTFVVRGRSASRDKWFALDFPFDCLRDKMATRQIHMNYFRFSSMRHGGWEEETAYYRGHTNEVLLEMRVERPEVRLQVASRDGRLDWSIDGFRKQLQMGLKRLREGVASPYFYTGPRGYRVRAQLLLHRKPVRLQLSFLTGEHDAHLPFFFPHSTAVSLVGPAWGQRRAFTENSHALLPHQTTFLLDLCPLSEIKKYLTNDSLRLIVEVLPTL